MRVVTGADQAPDSYSRVSGQRHANTQTIKYKCIYSCAHMHKSLSLRSTIVEWNYSGENEVLNCAMLEGKF